MNSKQRAALGGLTLKLACIVAMAMIGAAWMKETRTVAEPKCRKFVHNNGAMSRWGNNYPWLESAGIGELYCEFPSEHTTALVTRSLVTRGSARGSQQSLTHLCQRLREVTCQ